MNAREHRVLLLQLAAVTTLTLIVGPVKTSFAGFGCKMEDDETIDHIELELGEEYRMYNGTMSYVVEFRDNYGNPMEYTGDVLICVTDNEHSEFTREDYYWDDAEDEVKTIECAYHKGAEVGNYWASPPTGKCITISVEAETATWFSLYIYTPKRTEVSVCAAGCIATDSISEVWMQGRATYFRNTRDDAPDDPYQVALPHASQVHNMIGTSIHAREAYGTGDGIDCAIGDTGPLVPRSPYYPPDDTSYNEYWEDAGSLPLAVSLQEKIRARQIDGNDCGDYKFNSQIIDLDDYHEDDNGDSARDLLIDGADDGRVEWRF